MLTPEFARNFRVETEANWASRDIRPEIYGFQIQRGTRWNPGLTDDQISEYERVLGSHFPDDLKTLLREMNGTDRETINIYGSSGTPSRTRVGVYAYPQDLAHVQERIAKVEAHRAAVVVDLARQGFNLGTNAKLFPFYGHRYVVCARDVECCVLSIQIQDVDAIVFARSLAQYLEREFLNR